MTERGVCICPDCGLQFSDPRTRDLEDALKEIRDLPMTSGDIQAICSRVLNPVVREPLPTEPDPRLYADHPLLDPPAWTCSACGRGNGLLPWCGGCSTFRWNR